MAALRVQKCIFLFENIIIVFLAVLIVFQNTFYTCSFCSTESNNLKFFDSVYKTLQCNFRKNALLVVHWMEC